MKTEVENKEGWKWEFETLKQGSHFTSFPPQTFKCEKFLKTLRLVCTIGICILNKTTQHSSLVGLKSKIY